MPGYVRHAGKVYTIDDAISLGKLDARSKPATEAEFHDSKLQISGKEGFINAAMPLITYLAENYHPHVKAIVTSTGAELLEGLESTGEILDFLKD